jgi:hypothetical protein
MLRNCKCDDIIISQNLDVSVYAQLLRVLAAGRIFVLGQKGCLVARLYMPCDFTILRK